MERRARVTVPYELLYAGIAAGMWLYTRRAFQVVVLNETAWRRPVGRIVVSTHRSNADVPLICATLFFRDGMWRHIAGRPHFAARGDLFEPGILAVLAPGVPLAVRRLLFRINPGPHLGNIRVSPIRAPRALKLVQALAALPTKTPLGDVLPPELVQLFETSAAAAGIPVPTAVGDTWRLELVEALWADVTADDLTHPAFAERWRRRGAEAAEDVRRLIDVVRSGETLLLFPEGRPSPDGSIGPLQRGLALVVRRGRPDGIVPVGIAYDELTRGRPLAYIAARDPIRPPPETVEDAVLAALRRTTPLTCGQVVSHLAVRAARAGRSALTPAEADSAFADAVERADSDGRPFDRSFLEPRLRRRRLTDCLHALARRPAVRTAGSRALELDPERVLADDGLLRLARERESARA